MAIRSDSNFPLLMSDQEDVIRIYLELTRERDRAGCVSEVTANNTNELLGPHNNSNDLSAPNELFGLE